MKYFPEFSSTSIKKCKKFIFLLKIKKQEVHIFSSKNEKEIAYFFIEEKTWQLAASTVRRDVPESGLSRVITIVPTRGDNGGKRRKGSMLKMIYDASDPGIDVGWMLCIFELTAHRGRNFLSRRGFFFIVHRSKSGRTRSRFATTEPPSSFMTPTK